MKRILGLFIFVFSLSGVNDGDAAQAQLSLRLATTTSTDNSGLLQFILPAFEKETQIQVQVIAVGSGKALELGRNGDVDVVLVHARAAEDQFVAHQYGVDRRDVMYNDFVLVGPSDDPAAIAQEKNLMAALARLVQSHAKFISRGDRSGTEMMEHSYWASLGQKPDAGTYIAAGVGMGEALQMAGEMRAYTLSDRATYYAYRAKTGLRIVFAGDEKMRNPYGIIAVNPARHSGIHYDAALKLIQWLGSKQGKAKISGFQVQGQQVFFPY